MPVGCGGKSYGGMSRNASQGWGSLENSISVKKCECLQGKLAWYKNHISNALVSTGFHTCQWYELVARVVVPLG